MKLSLGNQYFVGDLSTLDTYDTARSRAEARRVAEAIAARGGRPAVGYLAIPISLAPRFGRSIDELFDGCVNIGIGTAMLSAYGRTCTVESSPPGHRHHRRRRAGQIKSRRACILRRLE